MPSRPPPPLPLLLQAPRGSASKLSALSGALAEASGAARAISAAVRRAELRTGRRPEAAAARGREGEVFERKKKVSCRRCRRRNRSPMRCRTRSKNSFFSFKQRRLRCYTQSMTHFSPWAAQKRQAKATSASANVDVADDVDRLHIITTCRCRCPNWSLRHRRSSWLLIFASVAFSVIATVDED